MPTRSQIGLNEVLEKSIKSGTVLSMCYGVFIGWSIFSGGVRDFWNLNMSELHITIVQSSFYVFAMIGVLFGVFLFGTLGTINLQKMSTLLAILSSTGHLLVATTPIERIVTMTLSRSIAGFGFGIFYPIFVRKISEQCYKTYRGRYTIIAPFSLEFGIWFFVLFRYTFTRFDPIAKVGVLCLIMAFISFISMFFNKQFESFVLYIMRGEPSEAFIIFTELRKTHTLDDQRTEFAEIEQLIVQQPSRFLTTKINYQAYIYLGLTKVAYVLVSNAFIFMFLQKTLLQVTTPNVKHILLFVMILQRVLVSIACYLFIDKIGRRKLMMISAGVTGLIFISLGIVEVTSLKPGSEPNVPINWIIYALFVLLQSAAGIGITIIPDISAAEIIPFRHRKLAMSSIYILEYLLFLVIVIVVYSSVDGEFGQGFMFVWGSILLVIGVATKYLIFETNNKSLAEIWSNVMHSS